MQMYIHANKKIKSNLQCSLPTTTVYMTVLLDHLNYAYRQPCHNCACKMYAFLVRE